MLKKYTAVVNKYFHDKLPTWETLSINQHFQHLFKPKLQKVIESVVSRTHSVTVNSRYALNNRRTRKISLKLSTCHAVSHTRARLSSVKLEKPGWTTFAKHRPSWCPECTCCTNFSFSELVTRSHPHPQLHHLGFCMPSCNLWKQCI